jgi:DNA-binding response OmpR family regulator
MPKKILIADDDPDILDVMKIILEGEGFEVSITPFGNDLKHIKDNLPDLIILDIRMSGVDGTEIAKFLKGQSHTQMIPLIIVSADRDTDSAAKAAGADDFIHKPFEIASLIEKVRKNLGL